MLKDVSFTVDFGQSVALVGHTGSGKTTITNLLMRFYDVQRGRILLDGVDIRDWDLQSLRQNFAVVLQDVFLFSDSVASNISFVKVFGSNAPLATPFKTCIGVVPFLK